jgi:hypothetical protein
VVSPRNGPGIVRNDKGVFAPDYGTKYEHQNDGLQRFPLVIAPITASKQDVSDLEPHWTKPKEQGFAEIAPAIERHSQNKCQ